MVNLIIGDEPYLIDNTVKEAIKELDDMNIVVYEQLSSEVFTRALQYPFLSSRQVLIVRPTTLGTLEKDTLSYLDEPEEFTDIYIIPEQVDKRTAAYLEFKKRGLIKECNKISAKRFEVFTIELLNSLNKQITGSCYNYFVERCGYFEDADITLYTVKIYLEQLACMEEAITSDIIDSIVEKSVTQKTFVLSGLLLEGDTKKLFTMANYFLDEGENAIGMLSLLMRVFRLAYKATLYGEKSEQEISKLIGVPVYQFRNALKYSPTAISAALDILQKGVNDIKSGRAASRVVFIKCLGEVLSTLKV